MKRLALLATASFGAVCLCSCGFSATDRSDPQPYIEDLRSAVERMTTEDKQAINDTIQVLVEDWEEKELVLSRNPGDPAEMASDLDDATLWNYWTSVAHIEPGESVIDPNPFSLSEGDYLYYTVSATGGSLSVGLTPFKTDPAHGTEDALILLDGSGVYGPVTQVEAGSYSLYLYNDGDEDLTQIYSTLTVESGL